jgi:exonuclease III
LADQQKELDALRKRIATAQIPPSQKDNFRLLTWNIRNFGKNKESRAISYIAEICKNFDIIAIQEVKDSLDGLEKLQRALGIRYKFLFSDASGNGERLAFLYDSTKVQFTGLAAEVVVKPGAGRKKNDTKDNLEFDRTPYVASFRVNGCNFIIVTVHIFFGKSSEVQYRLKEIQNLAKYLKDSSRDTDALDSDYITCGDFNIDNLGDEKLKTKSTSKKILNQLFSALQSQKLIIEKDIQNSPSNLEQTRHYDQIGYHHYRDSTITFQKGGIINFVGAVYVGDEKLSYKLTDHLPMWACFTTKPDKKPKYLNP